MKQIIEGPGKIVGLMISAHLAYRRTTYIPPIVMRFSGYLLNKVTLILISNLVPG